jgi:hypothetical protein
MTPAQPNPEQLARQLAEIMQRPGEDIADYFLRMAELNRPKGQHGAPRGMNRKNLLRRLSKLRKGSDPPLDPQDPAFVEFMRGQKAESDKVRARRQASLIATYKRLESDPVYRERFPWAPHPGESLKDFLRRQDAHMVKPWKGSGGRRVIKKNGATATRKLSKKDFAIALRDEQPDLTNPQIAQRLTKEFKLKKPCAVRTVRGYLNAG